MPLLLVCALLVATPAPRAADALVVLHAWDQRREAAWAAGDESAVGALYVPGSRAGAADLHLLRAYAARGLVVRRIDTQVFGARVLAVDARHLRIAVRDRVAGGQVVQGRAVVPLGTTAPSTRVVVLRRDGATWRVVSVRSSGGAPRG